MTEPRQVILTKITPCRNVVQLEYVCDICYKNPRLKRKHKTHYHGSGHHPQGKSFLAIDWNKRQSFGTRIPHCSHIYIEYKPEKISTTSDFIKNLPEVELIYDPEITVKAF